MNPKCPYCGTEMRREWCGFYYECPKCFSQSPYVEKGSTRAAAMKRYVEPNRVLSWQELLDHPNDLPIVYEGQDGVLELAYNDLPTQKKLGIIERARTKYGRRGRAWLRVPTDEERQAAKWGDAP